MSKLHGIMEKTSFKSASVGKRPGNTAANPKVKKPKPKSKQWLSPLQGEKGSFSQISMADSHTTNTSAMTVSPRSIGEKPILKLLDMVRDDEYASSRSNSTRKTLQDQDQQQQQSSASSLYASPETRKIKYLSPKVKKALVSNHSPQSSQEDSATKMEVKPRKMLPDLPVELSPTPTASPSSADSKKKIMKNVVTSDESSFNEEHSPVESSSSQHEKEPAPQRQAPSRKEASFRQTSQENLALSAPTRRPSVDSDDADMAMAQAALERDSDGSGEMSRDTDDEESRTTMSLNDTGAGSSDQQAIEEDNYSASYGSVSLGGDASLSSNDSFNNSPNDPMVETVKFRRPSKPDLAAKPKKAIIKKVAEPNPTRRRQRYVSSDEESFSSNSSYSSHSFGKSQVSAASSSTKSSSKPRNPQDDSAVSVDFSIPTNSESSLISSPAKNSTRLRSIASGDSGDISIATISEGINDDDDRSLRFYPPIYHPTVDSRRSSISSVTGSKLSSNVMSQDDQLSGDSSMGESWMAPDSRNEYSTDMSGKKKSLRSAQSNRSKSTGSWTCSVDWDKPKDASKHWAGTDLSAWTSGDDSSSSVEDENISSPAHSKEASPSQNNGSRDQNSDLHNRLSSPKRKESRKREDKPRSGYDKSAAWYCGEDDDDLQGSMNSDTSSILSAFRAKKMPVKKQQLEPASDRSMSFSDLAGANQASADLERSMSFSALQNSEKAVSKRSIKPDRLEGLLEELEESLHSVSPADLMEPNSDPKDSSMSTDSDSGGEPLKVPVFVEFDESPLDEKNNKLEDGVRLFSCIGVVLFLIFDITLLSLWLTRRETDDSSGGLSTVLASVPDTICFEWIPGQGKSDLCTMAETALGGGVANLLAMAIMSGSPEAVDLSLIPAGMTGADIPAGDFTYETAHTVLQDADPARRQLRLGRRRQLDSASTLVTLEVTGGRIIQSLENCLEDSLAKGFASSYPYASGLRYSVDATASFNQRLVSPVVFKKDVWGPLESDEDYTIITTKEWAEEYFQSQGQATDLTSFSALTEFAQQEKVLNAPEFSTREFVKGEEDPEENNNVGGDGERAIATVQDNICLDWVPGQGLSNVCSKEETATQGGGVGNLVAWGLLSQLETYGEDTEMFLFKGSDCQTDLVQGEFKEKDAQALLPFNHKLSVLSLTGEQLIMALEGAIDYVLESAGNEGSYPYAGGLRFSVNPFESFGKRVSDSEWFTRGRWKSINMAVTYRIGTTLPLAEGDDGYTSLDDAIGRVDTDYLIRDVFIDHATTVGTLENPPLERYSTQDYLQTPS